MKRTPSPPAESSRRSPHVLGSPADRKLVAALEHEMLRCRKAFDRFTYYGGREVMGDRSRVNVRRCHDAYADFLRHLYEFYVGAFKRDRLDLRDIDADTMNVLLTDLVTRYLARRVKTIEAGYAPSWENQASVYKVPVPQAFATQFRRIRNANSHVSVRRIEPDRDWSLAEFYDQCHLFVMVLFQDAHSWGHAARETDLGNIDSFSVARHLPKQRP